MSCSDTIDDSQILSIFYNKNGNVPTSVKSKAFLPAHPEILSYLRNRYDDIPEDKWTYLEVIWRIKNHIEERPVCRVCKKPVKFEKGHFYKTCSRYCSHHDRIAIEKAKATNLERYDSTSVLNSEIVQEKIRATMMRRYGCLNPSQSQEIQRHKKETCIKKYGTDYHISSNVVREKAHKKWNSNSPLTNKDVSKKAQDTCIERYGSRSYLGSEENKRRYEDPSFVNAWLKKQYATKEANRTFNSSRVEDTLFTILEALYKDVKRNYHKDHRYPFNCDFYLPSVDVFIELNRYMTHGDHPFDENDPDDLKELESLQEKASRYNRKNLYQAKIDTWTKRDFLKIETAKRNRLRYVVIYKEVSEDDVRALVQRSIDEGFVVY